MARAKTNKLYRTFTKGLITEASPLTYPEDASIDELNTVISRKGNRTRRVGIEYQSGYAFVDVAINSAKVITELMWLSANNNPLKNYLVIQVGSIIHFYTIGEGAMSANKHPDTINLSDYRISTAQANVLDVEPASFSAGAGFLFIAHRFCDSIVVEYDETLNKFKPVRVILQIRDFEGVNDGLPNDAEPSTLSKEHLYNLRNQGWINSGSAGVVSVSGANLGAFPASSYSFGNVIQYYDSFTGQFMTYGQNGNLEPYFDPHTREF